VPQAQAGGSKPMLLRPPSTLRVEAGRDRRRVGERLSFLVEDRPVALDADDPAGARKLIVAAAECTADKATQIDPVCHRSNEAARNGRSAGALRACSSRGIALVAAIVGADVEAEIAAGPVVYDDRRRRLQRHVGGERGSTQANHKRGCTSKDVIL